MNELLEAQRSALERLVDERTTTKIGGPQPATGRVGSPAPGPELLKARMHQALETGIRVHQAVNTTVDAKLSDLRAAVEARLVVYQSEVLAQAKKECEHHMAVDVNMRSELRGLSGVILDPNSARGDRPFAEEVVTALLRECTARKAEDERLQRSLDEVRMIISNEVQNVTVLSTEVGLWQREESRILGLFDARERDLQVQRNEAAEHSGRILAVEAGLQAEREARLAEAAALGAQFAELAQSVETSVHQILSHFDDKLMNGCLAAEATLSDLEARRTEHVVPYM